jgi:dihydroorotate dehydrogenase (fumarate)
MPLDLSTRYLGLSLRNPLVVSACPLTNESHLVERLEQAGASAVVLSSLFQEQIDVDEENTPGCRSDRIDDASLRCVPGLDDYNAGADSYLRHLENLKKSVSIPVIASLNGTRLNGWHRFARLMEQAGADALELNVYFVPMDPAVSGAQIEQQYFELVAAVRAVVKIPLAVKIGPFFSSLPYMAGRLVSLGVDGLVLFNRFLQPDIDIETRQVKSTFTLSSRDELRLPLRWIGILREQVPVSLAATTGVHCGEDVVKLLMAGADVTMMASALIQHGPSYLNTVLDELRSLMSRLGIDSVEQIKGSLSQHKCHDPGAFERANYLTILAAFSSRRR